MDATTLADRYWDSLLEIDPLLATQVGDERGDDRLPDASPAGIERRLDAHTTALKEARGSRANAADVWSRIILDTIEAIAEPEAQSIELGFHQLAPINQLWGPGTLLDQFATLQRADTPQRVERYLRRLSSVGDYLDDIARLLLESPEGVVAPRVIVERCIRQIDDIIATRPEDSTALRPIPSNDAGSRSAAVDILRKQTIPGYARYRKALGAYERRARATIGLQDLPDGDEIYRVRVLRNTSLPLDPSEIHEIGVRELAKIQQERVNVARSLGAATPTAALADYLRSDHGHFASRDEILALAQDQVERGWEQSQRFFGRLPDRNCEVKPVDPSREADVLEHYWPATPDGSRPPVYYVNTANPDQRSRHSLASTSFHEANPGHHLQISLEQKQKQRPSLLRLGGELGGTAFIEGWGLYSERLADEMGLFADEYERLGMLELQALRAARLVVDTGVHAFGWTRDRVVETLESTGLGSDRATLETDRYIADPGQALAYKIGQIEFDEGRRRSQKELGERFSLRDFHDRVLTYGSMPLASFRREVRGATDGPTPSPVNR